MKSHISAENLKLYTLDFKGDSFEAGLKFPVGVFVGIFSFKRSAAYW
jgi:hypothetical protein